MKNHEGIADMQVYGCLVLQVLIEGNPLCIRIAINFGAIPLTKKALYNHINNQRAQMEGCKLLKTLRGTPITIFDRIGWFAQRFVGNKKSEPPKI